MEGVLSSGLRDILVGADTSGFEGLARELFVFVGYEVNAEREIIYGGAFPAQVKDPDLMLTSAYHRKNGAMEEDLGIRDTSVIPRLGIWLVLAVAIAAGWTTTHLEHYQTILVSEGPIQNHRCQSIKSWFVTRV
jgi:hypothetical protein